jgi:hypothetical protein
MYANYGNAFNLVNVLDSFIREAGQISGQFAKPK